MQQQTQEGGKQVLKEYSTTKQRW